jgi:hypothetical protein
MVFFVVVVVTLMNNLLSWFYEHLMLRMGMNINTINLSGYETST